MGGPLGAITVQKLSLTLGSLSTVHRPVFLLCCLHFLPLSEDVCRSAQPGEEFPLTFKGIA